MRSLFKGYRPRSGNIPFRLFYARSTHLAWSALRPGRRRSPSQCSPSQSRRERSFAAHFSSSIRRRATIDGQRLYSSIAEDGTISNIPPAVAAKDAKTWARLLESFLPSELRSGDFTAVGSADSDALSLEGIPLLVVQARQTADVDVLRHISVTEGRWDAMLWLAKVIIDVLEPSISMTHQRRVRTSGTPPDLQPLNEMTSSPLLPDEFITGMISTQTLRNITATASDSDYLKHSIASKERLGTIWKTLASLILVARDKGPDESRFIMSYVLQVLAHIHRKGLIPVDTYSFTPSDDAASLRKPPILYILHSRIMAALSDNINESFPFQTSNNADQLLPDQLTQHEPQVVYKTDFFTLTPEVWLEFILWCCVHGGWANEGASIIREMRKETGKLRWSLINWRESMNDPQERWNTLLQHGTQANHVETADDTSLVSHPGSWTPATTAGVERSISAEVVVALVDGLVDTATRVPLSRIHPLVDDIKILKSVLARDKMSLGVTTWDSVICRLCEIPQLKDDNNPRIMESLLGLAETYGRELVSTNSPSNPHSSGSSHTYVFDATAAILGLFHRTICAYVKFRDLERALRMLARLQQFTDSNKERSIEGFVLRLKSVRKAAPIAYFNDAGRKRTIFPGIQYPSFFPSIPVRILCELLDMIVEQGETDVGRWLIYSSDVDGPLIPEELYGDPIMAPALIRFAAATLDKELLSSVIRAQGANLSGATLLAVCELEIRSANWSGAAEVLRMTLDQTLYVWTPQDFALLIRSLLAYIPFEQTVEPSGTNNADCAVIFLQRLLRGDLGRVWSESFRQIDSITGIIASISPALASLCSNMLTRRHHYWIDTPVESFNLILDGAVKAYGCSIGPKLWESWCVDDQPSVEVSLKVPAERGTAPSRPNILEQFSLDAGSRPRRLEENTVAFSGTIEPSIATIRVIVQQALAELRGEAEPMSSTQSGGTVQPSIPATDAKTVLEWAAQILKAEFALSDPEIDYELQGHASTLELDLDLSTQPTYSPDTLQIWRAFWGARKRWALDSESRLRGFAADRKEKQLIMEPAPPAERFFLRMLAKDLGLASESFGDATERAVHVSKTNKPAHVPIRRVEETWELMRSEKMRSNN